MLDISDAIRTLIYLFLENSSKLDCERAADVDATGELDVSDIVYLLNYLFISGGELKEPFPDCGFGIGQEDLSCDDFAPCANS